MEEEETDQNHHEARSKKLHSCVIEEVKGERFRGEGDPQKFIKLQRGAIYGYGEDNIIPVNSCRNFLVDRVAGFKRPSALSFSLFGTIKQKSGSRAFHVEIELAANDRVFPLYPPFLYSTFLSTFPAIVPRVDLPSIIPPFPSIFLAFPLFPFFRFLELILISRGINANESSKLGNFIVEFTRGFRRGRENWKRFSFSSSSNSRSSLRRKRESYS